MVRHLGWLLNAVDAAVIAASSAAVPGYIVFNPAAMSASLVAAVIPTSSALLLN